MKRLTNALLAFSAMLFFACGGGQKPATTADSSLKEIEAEMKGLKSYVMKAITTTNEDGTQMKMKTTIWHDVANDKTATEMEMEMTAAGFSHTSHTLNIEDGEWMYIINLKDNTGHKMRSTGDDGMFDFEVEEDEATLRQLIEADGGRILGNETFLGRKCIVVETVEYDYDYGTITTKLWLYKGIPLKMVSDNMKMEVTQLEENVRIPADRFKVPSGVSMR